MQTFKVKRIDQSTPAWLPGCWERVILNVETQAFLEQGGLDGSGFAHHFAKVTDRDDDTYWFVLTDHEMIGGDAGLDQRQAWFREHLLEHPEGRKLETAFYRGDRRDKEQPNGTDGMR